jgi:hypothetical protein
MIGYALIPQLWAYTNGPVQAPLVNDRPVGVPLTFEQIGVDAGRGYDGGTPLGFEIGFLLGGLVVVPVTIVAADLFTRFVDEPIVRFARKIEMRVGPDQS